MYTVFYIFIWLLAWLPLRVLYVFSDFFYLIIYYIVGYRKKIARKNIEKSFPEKSKKELRRIERRFFRYFCDLFIETFYEMHMSEKEVLQRMDLGDIDLIMEQYAKGRSIMLMSAHYGNWEWSGTLLGSKTLLKVLGAYSPLKNQFFDRKIKSSRSQFGSILLSSKEIGRVIEENKNTPSLIGLIADQSPSNYRKSYWINFLNQPTPVFTGPEKTALKYNLPVVFAKVEKIKRGYYTLEFEIVRDNENVLNEIGDITRVHSKLLEKCIKERPELWLWSHRRWKNKHYYYSTPNLIVVDKI